ncbi:ArnT family glycosyltransferase [Pontibacter ruber]|uniref:ArnT family glycosyltransferase n=1 Tax=Pontibacter ruber TaxID=1343895 RepID=A0ABW5D2L0_9BACT|nr:glycosyltransferase family 39 protein [Pontibacter ruber]
MLNSKEISAVNPSAVKKSFSLLTDFRVQVLLLLLLAGITFFPNLGASDPTLMEARNFITVREMTQNGRWLIPTMNGQNRLAKPPLPTWITAVSGIIAGDVGNLAALRLPAAVVTTLLVFFLFFLARQLTSDRLIPFFAAAILGSSFAVVNIGRQGTWDIYCHSFMLGAIWLLVKGWKRPEDNKGSFVLCGVLLGCSFLSKGPVSFYALLLPFLVSYVYGFGLKKPERGGLIIALASGLLLSAGWPLYTYLTLPEELARNVSGESTAWLNRHVRPFWYYWGFPAQAGAWTLFAVAALAVPYARQRIRQLGNYKFLIGWVLLTMLLLSLVPEKKERYLLPALIPLALLTAHYLRYLQASFKSNKLTRWDNRIILLNVVLYTLASFCFPVLMYVFAYRAGLVSTATQVAITGAGVLLGCFILLFAAKRIAEGVLLVVLVLNAFVLLVGLPLWYGVRYPGKHYQSLKEVRNIKELQALPYFAVGGMSATNIWEVGQTVDSLSIANRVLELPTKLPAVIFSPFPLQQVSLPQKNISLQFIRTYHYNRKNEQDVFYVYTLGAVPAKF